MVWKTPTPRATGYLVTSDDWNDDIVDNLAYLKGEAGIDIEIEEDIILSSGKYLLADKIFAGPRYTVHKGTVREQRIDWQDDTLGNYQISNLVGNGGAVQMGGSGQIVLKVDLDDGVGSYAAIYNLAEQNSARDTSWTVTKNPYMRWEFCLDDNDVAGDIFIGFRATPAGDIPTANEVMAGLSWNGTTWYGQNSDGGGSFAQTDAGAITQNVRHVVEVLITSATSVEIYVDGSLVHNGTTLLPTGVVEWHATNWGKDGGAGEDSHLTLGLLICQEALG
jgi:hypothetical protein